ncbi:MAG: hypothetical protein ACJ74Y_06765 [Bryobacteraceae bacterium]
MTDAQDRGLKFAYFLIGVALPIVGLAFWVRANGLSGTNRRAQVDKAHDVTVEDSFPASDPPSAW